MRITRVHIKLIESDEDRLLAFCAITWDDVMVMRDLKIINGNTGQFVSMPSRKFVDRCKKCNGKNHLLAKHCNECGIRLDDNRATRDFNGKLRLNGDIVHPINRDCRNHIQEVVLQAFENEKIKASQSDYICIYDKFDYADAFSEPDSVWACWLAEAPLVKV